MVDQNPSKSDLEHTFEFFLDADFIFFTFLKPRLCIILPFIDKSKLEFINDVLHHYFYVLSVLFLLSGFGHGWTSEEFFQLISEAVFNPSYGMFVSSEENNMDQW